MFVVPSHNWLTQLAFWPNSNSVPGTQTSLTRTCSLLGATPWRLARTVGNGGGDPALVTDARDGARGDGNSEGGPALATDAHRDNNGNGDVRGPPALGKVTTYGTDTAAGAAANDAEHCHD